MMHFVTKAMPIHNIKSMLCTLDDTNIKYHTMKLEICLIGYFRFISRE